MSLTNESKQSMFPSEMSEISEKRGLKRKEFPVVWSRAMTLRLIDLYESHSNLWDGSSESYKNKIVRKSSLDDISKKLGISSQDVKDKIHNLRCQFHSINKKRKMSTRSDLATEDALEVKWEFYDAMKFIDRLKIDTIETLKVEQDDFFLGFSSDSPENTSFSETSRCNTPPTTSRDDGTQSSTMSAFARLAAKKRKIEERKDLLDKCLGVMAQSPDSFKIFGDYVADELRNMNEKAPDLQFLAKREIQRVLLKMNDQYKCTFYSSPQ